MNLNDSDLDTIKAIIGVFLGCHGIAPRRLNEYRERSKNLANRIVEYQKQGESHE